MSLPSEEQWRPVPGYEGLYEVSNHGRVRSLPSPRRTRGRVLKPTPNARGYLTVTLVGRTWGVHMLVALAFLGPREDRMQVRHLDGDSLNNALTNLAWGTQGENERDKVRHGTHRNAQKTHCPQGHAYTPENTVRVGARQHRACRTCITARREAVKRLRRAG